MTTLACSASQYPSSDSRALYCNPITLGPALEEAVFQHIRQRLALDFFKWDSQIGDVSTLFRQPLLIDWAAWHELEQMAEDLAAELMLAEQELAERSELHGVLGFTPALRAVLEAARRYGPTPSAVRTLRFDFHYTTEGWRISEVNSDVPGGYSEASCFPKLMAECFSCGSPAGNPADKWTDAMVFASGERGRVALLSAPGFLEDQQVTAFLAQLLQARGVETFLVHHPAQLTWKSGSASVLAKDEKLGLDAIVRFYQGEWLSNLNSQCGWERLFSGGKTPVANPGMALLAESKRFPLAWDRMRTKMTRLRNLLPECCDPASKDWQDNEAECVLKGAFSNTGDAVHLRASMDRRTWERLCRDVRSHPQRWVIQRRFEPVPIDSEVGAVYPCIGVYTINGRTAGVYGRISTRKIIDYAAMDAAVLIRNEGNVEQG